jgi:hypothetical protein
MLKSVGSHQDDSLILFLLKIINISIPLVSSPLQLCLAVEHAQAHKQKQLQVTLVLCHGVAGKDCNIDSHHRSIVCP